MEPFARLSRIPVLFATSEIELSCSPIYVLPSVKRLGGKMRLLPRTFVGIAVVLTSVCMPAHADASKAITSQRQ